MERLYKELKQYHGRDIYPFHMPGHKRNRLSSDASLPYEQDITEITGFDNLHHPEDILLRAQKELAELYGVKESFYSVNGSTAALLAAISASVKKRGRILMARNCHKAVYHAVYLRELTPVYLYPQTDMELGMNGSISPENVEKSLKEYPDTEAVLLTSPTYDGVVSDIKAIAEIVHRHGAALLVDEAHGAHFHFSEDFPTSAADLGADLVIHSLHKTLPSLTQTAALHRCSDRIDSNLLKRFFGIYETSSPSYLLMASIDACADKLSREGREMFAEFTQQLKKTRDRLRKCRHIRLVTKELLDERGIPCFDYDCSKLVFSTVNSRLNGKQLHEILRVEFHLEMEMDAENYVIALSSVGDSARGFERLCRAIEEIDRREQEQTGGNVRTEKHPVEHMEIIYKITPAEAMDQPFERLPLEDSIGRISTEFVYLYPPGVPLLVPGEQITGLLVENMRRYLEQGLDLQGLQDQTNASICVIKE